VRIAIGVLRQEPDAMAELAHALATAARAGDDAVHGERLGQDLADRHPRIQRGVRILEDHLHPPAHRPQLGGLQGRQLAPLEEHLTPRRPL